MILLGLVSVIILIVDKGEEANDKILILYIYLCHIIMKKDVSYD